MSYEHKYKKYKRKYLQLKSKNQYGGAYTFCDDISTLNTYAIYGHGLFSGDFMTLNPNQHIIYLGEPGKSYKSIDAVYLWKFLTSVGKEGYNVNDSIRDLKILLKLISGYIDDDVKNYTFNGRKLFENARFHKGGSRINNVLISFTPLQFSDITSEKQIENDDEVIKSGIYSVPIGENFFPKYCQNLDNTGSMLFMDYKKKNIEDLEDRNIFMKNSNDTYYCGLPRKLEGEQCAPIESYNNKKDLDYYHNRLIDTRMKPESFMKDGEFINKDYKYKKIKLDYIFDKFMNNIEGTYILPICRNIREGEGEEEEKISDEALKISKDAIGALPDFKSAFPICINIVKKIYKKMQYSPNKKELVSKFYNGATEIGLSLEKIKQGKLIESINDRHDVMASDDEKFELLAKLCLQMKN